MAVDVVVVVAVGHIMPSTKSKGPGIDLRPLLVPSGTQLGTTLVATATVLFVLEAAHCRLSLARLCH